MQVCWGLGRLRPIFVQIGNFVSWRMRKIEKIQTLDQQTSKLKAENDDLAGLAKKLKEQNYKLQQELRWHINNGTLAYSKLSSSKTFKWIISQDVNLARELPRPLNSSRNPFQLCLSPARCPPDRWRGRTPPPSLHQNKRTLTQRHQDELNYDEIRTVFNNWNHVQTTPAFTKHKQRFILKPVNFLQLINIIF